MGSLESMNVIMNYKMLFVLHWNVLWDVPLPIAVSSCCVYRMWAAGHGKVCVAVPGAGWYAVTKVHVVGECITLLLEVVSVTVCS